MCICFHEKNEESCLLDKNGWFSDEAHFHLNANVNSQNCRRWNNEPPDEINERTLNCGKCKL